MIKKYQYISFLSLLFTLYGCNKKPKLNCNQFKTGQYELVDATRDILIERTPTLQTETDRKTGTFNEFKVQWMNDCTYRLYFKAGEERFLEVWKTNFLEVTILGATEKGYAYQARFSDSDKIENYEIDRVR